MNVYKHGTKALFGGEELAKICSKSVHRTQPELHTHFLLLYTSAMAAIVNINGDDTGWMYEQ